MSTVKRGLRTRKLLPPAHSETAIKRGRDQTYGSTLSFFGTRVQLCWTLRVANQLGSKSSGSRGGGRRPAANALHCGTSNSSTPSRSCAAQLAAPRQGDAVSFSNAFTIVVATTGVLSLIMGKTSAHLAQWAAHWFAPHSLNQGLLTTMAMWQLPCEGCLRSLQGSAKCRIGIATLSHRGSWQTVRPRQVSTP